MTPQRDNESSAPTINPFALGEVIGEVRASLKAIEARLAQLPCAAHVDRLARIEAAARGHRVSEWLASNWKLAIPLVIALLATPTVRQCVGEQQAQQLQTQVRKLEERPATKVLIPIPQPIMAPQPAPKEEP